MAINCHFRQNHHFQKGPFAISFEFLFTIWQFWRLIAIFAKIATFQMSLIFENWLTVVDFLISSYFAQIISIGHLFQKSL